MVCIQWCIGLYQVKVDCLESKPILVDWKLEEEN